MFNFRFLLSDKFVVGRYKKVGLIFGEAVSMLYMGECVGFKKMFLRWERWEAEYVKRGYKPFSIDKFVSSTYQGEQILEPIEVLEEGELPVFHSKIYKERYLGKVRPLINLSRTMEGEVQFGYFIMPTTEL